MFRQEKEILLFSKTTRRFLEPSHLSVQWVPDFTPKVMQFLVITASSSLTSPLVLWSHNSYLEIDLITSSPFLHLFFYTILVMSNSHTCIWGLVLLLYNIVLSGPTASSRQDPFHFRGLTIALRHITLDKTPLDEWSARRRDFCLTTHDIHKRQISMPPVGFEPAISESEQTP